MHDPVEGVGVFSLGDMERRVLLGDDAVAVAVDLIPSAKDLFELDLVFDLFSFRAKESKEIGPRIGHEPNREHFTLVGDRRQKERDQREEG